VRLKKSINVYENACATLEVTRLLAIRDRFGSISAPFGETSQSFLLVQLNVRENGEGKIATKLGLRIWCDQRDPINVYKNACTAAQSNTFVSVGQV
jgi:hypothetical protein